MICEKENGHICDCLRCSAFLLEFLSEWGAGTDTPSQNVKQADFVPYKDSDVNNNQYIGGHFEDYFVNFGGGNDSKYFDNNNNQYNKNYFDDFGGGNYNQYCSLLHYDFNAETRLAKRNIDMDRMSKSSPEISSDSSSSSSSSDGAGTSQTGGNYKILKSTKKEKSPIIVITDDDVPTVLTHEASTQPASPSIIIYDDEGVEPIVNLQSSPIFAKAGRTRRGEQKTMMKKDSSSYFTPPQVTNVTDPDDFIKQIYFENVGVGLERINLDLILSRTTWGGGPMTSWRRPGWDNIIVFQRPKLRQLSCVYYQ